MRLRARQFTAYELIYYAVLRALNNAKMRRMGFYE